MFDILLRNYDYHSYVKVYRTKLNFEVLIIDKNLEIDSLADARPATRNSRRFLRNVKTDASTICYINIIKLAFADG